MNHYRQNFGQPHDENRPFGSDADASTDFGYWHTANVAWRPTVWNAEWPLHRRWQHAARESAIRIATILIAPRR